MLKIIVFLALFGKFAEMTSYSFDFVFLLRQIMSLSTILSVIISVVAAWNLLRARACGSKLMLWGLILQCVHGFITLLAFVSPIYAQSSLRAPLLSARLYMTTFSLSLSMIGILCFAIGYFLHAKKQRGLQSRVDELERILADLQERR